MRGRTGDQEVLADEKVLDLIVELLPPGGRILDVGCGGGHTLAALASRGVQGIGIDPHPYGRAPCQRLRAEEISTLGEQFDLVYTLHALHEFDAPERFPKQAKGVLQRAGILLIMDWVRGARTGARERYFAIETVVGWMAEAGFHILRQEVRGKTMIVAGRLPAPRTELAELCYQSSERTRTDVVWLQWQDHEGEPLAQDHLGGRAEGGILPHLLRRLGLRGLLPPQGA